MINFVECLGIAYEYKTKENFMQKSYVFVSEIKQDLQTQHLTKQEQDEGTVLLWLEPEEALNRIGGCLENLKASQYDSVYRTKFMVLRDKKILEYYIAHNKK